MSSIWAIGDIHGNSGQLDALLTRIHKEQEAGDLIVFLGDYIDRGPNSGRVVNLVWNEIKDGAVALWGNHEQMAAMSFGYEHPGITIGHPGSAMENWTTANNGGLATLKSFQLDGLPSTFYDYEKWKPKTEPFRDFFRRLKLFHVDEESGIEFVHAYAKPNLSLESFAQVPSIGSPHPSGADLMLWQKPTPGTRDDHPDRRVVVGHVAMKDGYPKLWGYHLMCDTGCGYGGPLTAARIPRRKPDASRGLWEGVESWSVLADGTIRITDMDGSL